MLDGLSPSAQRQRDAENAEAQAQRVAAAKADLQWVMGDAHGRRFVAGLLADAGIYRTSMAADAQLTAFNEGSRNAGLKLLARLTADAPDEYMVMEKERISNGIA